MSKKFRKVLAAILAGTMVLGSGVVANAAEGAKGEAKGTGDLDYAKEQDIFNVVLPTSAGTQFNYILNPTDVIGDTDHAKYASASFVDGKTMYFRNQPASGSDIATYSDVSDPITAYSKSTMDVQIKVKAKVATPSGIDIAASYQTDVAGSAASATATPSIYLGLMASGSTPGASTPITIAGIEDTATLSNANRYYEVVYATDSKTYKKQLNATGSNAKEEDGFDGIFDSHSFMLTGSCNPDGKWADVDMKDLPEVTLVWTIDKPENAATSSPITFTNTGDITVTGLTAAKNFAHKMTLSWGDTVSDNLDSDPNMSWDITQWSEANGGTLKFKLSNGWVSGLSGELVTVTVYLTDGSTLTATTQF